ncbi:protein BIC1-like [Cocos nucifera]|uniref:Protein BIC1-like n=1 Tax=Cocos nucifera TaxID=13894 RepID=A0A8K0IWB6_COCNU|nr:protein BIC1-like [Cocos nucifera]
MENSKEKTRVSDSHEDPVPPSESQMENSKQPVASDMSSKNGGGGGKIECSNNPESSQSEIPKEASSNGPSVEDCGREKLKRHRMEMAGRVWIPERWGQESLLKDWKDCAAFDRYLVPKGLTLAREALVDECRRSNSGSLRVENRC